MSKWGEDDGGIAYKTNQAVQLSNMYHMAIKSRLANYSRMAALNAERQNKTPIFNPVQCMVGHPENNLSKSNSTTLVYRPIATFF